MNENETLEKQEPVLIEVDPNAKKKKKKRKKENGTEKKNKKVFVLLFVVFLFLVGVFLIFLKYYDIEKKEEEYFAQITNTKEKILSALDEQELEYQEDVTYYFNALQFDVAQEVKDTFQDAYFVYGLHEGKDYYAWTSLDKDHSYLPFSLFDELNKEKLQKDSLKTKVSLLTSFEWSNKIIVFDENFETTEYLPGYELEKKEAEKCYQYIQKEETITILDYVSSCGKDLEIPSYIDSVPVTAIESSAFYDKGIERVIFHENLKSIGDYSFAYNSIKEVTFPESLEKISSFAFYEANVEKVTFGSKLTTIGDYAFAKNKITKVELPKTHVTIGDYAFYQNEMTELSVLGSMSLGVGSFSKNKVAEENAYIYGYDKNKKIDYTTIVGYSGTSTKLTIPSKKEKVSLQKIGKGAFASLDLEEVTLPSTLKTIDAAAFQNNKLKELTIPKGVVVVGAEAFRNNLLEKISIPSTVIFMGTGSFINNQLSDEDAFIYRRTMGGIDYSSIVSYGGKKRDQVIIPETANKKKLTSIDGFYSSSLTSFTIPNSVTTIANGAFNNNNVASGEENEYIYQRKNGKVDYSTIISYAGSKAKITLPQEKEGVELTTIAPYAFAYCNLEEVEVPTSITTIGENAFYKSTISNSNLGKIINKTGKSLSWNKIVGSTDDASFEEGEATSSYGKVQIVK